MPIVIQSNLPLAITQAASAPVVLQPGSVISAKVLQVLASQISGGDTVRIAIGGQTLDVQSQVSLQAGQTLQLAVSQTADGGVRLAVVNGQGASASQGPVDAGSTGATTVTLAPEATASLPPPTQPVTQNNQLTPLESLAVSVAAQSAATQQTSLAPLFANLGVAAALGSLPPQVQQAVAQVLAQRISLDQNLTGADIKQAFEGSGLFLEASLASGSLSPSASPPDLKAALIVLRQVLTTSLNGAAATPAVLSQGATPAAVLQQGGMSAEAQQAATPAAVVQQGASAAPAAAVQPEGATPVVVLVGQGTGLPAEILSQPLTITAGPETPTTISPSLAPLLAPEIAPSATSLQGAAASTQPDIINQGPAAQTLAPASAADAAARTAASSAALNLLQEVVQAGPLGLANATGLLLENNQMLALVPAATGTRIAPLDDAEFAHTNVPPPISGALPTAQPVTPATLVSNSSFETAMHRLLTDTDGAIARQTLLQVASLPGQTDATTARVDPAAPRWNFEIPFATPQGTAMAQFEISRDGGNEVEAAKRVWRARFSLDVEPAGPVHALVSLSGDRTSVRMWAERPATAAQLRAGAAQLSQALSKAELHPGDILIRDGTPPQSAPARAGHFLDRAL
jgi:Flagellar hook-length control protein FliK